MKSRILLVEDDSTLSMIVADTLRRYGFDVETAADGEEGIVCFARHGADVVVADVMMPRLDGFEMAGRIRRLDSEVPILFLTAKSSIDDVVHGFELGGNDYLAKPFRMMELVVRIKALLRRPAAPESVCYSIGAYLLDMSTQTLALSGHKPVELSLIEAKLLKELAVNVGSTVEAADLSMLIWKRDDPYTRNSLHGFVHKLRRYLRHDATVSIINQRGRGYMLAVESARGS